MEPFCSGAGLDKIVRPGKCVFGGFLLLISTHPLFLFSTATPAPSRFLELHTVAPLSYHLLRKSLSVGPPALLHSPPHHRPVRPASSSFNINLPSSPRADPGFVRPEAYTVLVSPLRKKNTEVRIQNHV